MRCDCERDEALAEQRIGLDLAGKLRVRGQYALDMLSRHDRIGGAIQCLAQSSAHRPDVSRSRRAEPAYPAG